MRILGFTLLILAATGAAYATSPSGYAGSYEAFVDSAEQQASGGRFAEAAEYYRKALRENPGSPLNSKLLANLGMCLSETGQYDDAIEALDVALVREPESVPILSARAKVLFLAGRHDDARADLDKALSQDSLAFTPLLMRGRLLLMQGHPEKGLEDFKMLLRHYPDTPAAAAGAAGCLEAMREPVAASDYYRQALSKEQNPEWYQGLIGALINSNQIDEAESEAVIAIEKYPRVAQMYLLRGVIHLVRNRSAEAIADKKIAIGLGIPPETADLLIPLKIPK